MKGFVLRPSNANRVATILIVTAVSIGSVGAIRVGISSFSRQVGSETDAADPCPRVNGAPAGGLKPLRNDITLAPAEGSAHRVVNVDADRDPEMIRAIRIEADAPVPFQVTEEKLEIYGDPLIRTGDATLETVAFKDLEFREPRYLATAVGSSSGYALTRATSQPASSRPPGRLRGALPHLQGHGRDPACTRARDSPAGFVEFMAANYGPLRAREGLAKEGRWEELHAELVALSERSNVARAASGRRRSTFWFTGACDGAISTGATAVTRPSTDGLERTARIRDVRIEGAYPETRIVVDLYNAKRGREQSEEFDLYGESFRRSDGSQDAAGTVATIVAANVVIPD